MKVVEIFPNGSQASEHGTKTNQLLMRKEKRTEKRFVKNTAMDDMEKSSGFTPHRDNKSEFY